MKVSIALATCNGEAYLQDQLDSYLRQTRLPDELVVCDDASSDGTLAILESFRAQAPFAVHVYANESNLGYTKNFEKVLSLAQGDLVFLSDQDDVWLPEKIQVLCDAFDKEMQQAVLLVHDVAYCRSDLTPIGQTKIERMQGAFDLDADFVVGMATAVRRDFLALCFPFPAGPATTHDSWLHRCANAVGGKQILPVVLASYRRHEECATVEGSLNVDYVTEGDYFQRKKSIGDILRRNETVDISDPEITEWLKVQREGLSERGYASNEKVDAVISEQQIKQSVSEDRKKLLARGRLQRWWSVFQLYQRGGYRHFNGWKSAIKDLLIQ